MKRHLLYVVAVALGMLTTGCVFEQMVGSGVPSTTAYLEQDFSTVSFSHGCNATIEQSDSFSIEVTIDDNLEQFLVVENENGILSVGLESGRFYNTSLFKVKIKAPEYTSIQGSGGTTIGIRGTVITNGTLTVDLSGGSKMEGMCTSRDLRARLSGGSRLSLDGSGQDLTVCASGGGNAQLYYYIVEDCNAVLSGGSTAQVNASGRITGELSGGSRLDYKGGAILGHVQKSGGSTVNRK